MRKNKLPALVLSLAMALALTAPASAYDASRPGAVPTLSAGAAESFYIDPSGTLWAWGDNSSGQLGDGTMQDRSRPVKVMEGVRSVSAGDGHTYAVLEDNTLWAWGRNIDDAFMDVPVEGYSAVPVKLMDDVAAASTGTCVHLALKTDGTLWSWGQYVGDGTEEARSTPWQVMDHVTAVSAGYGHSLALKEDGTLWTWGRNPEDTMGTNKTHPQLSPVKVLDDVAQMSAGYNFSAAVKKDGTLWTWGQNWRGQLADGTLWIWGQNWSWEDDDQEMHESLQETLAAWLEQWGPEANRDHTVPFQVMEDVAAVYVANNTGYALKTDGTLWGWGSNRVGAVGDGTAEDRLLPVKIMDGVARAAAGWDHVLVQKSDGTLWTWGANLSGQLGNGESGFIQYFDPLYSASPIQISISEHPSQEPTREAAPTNDSLTADGQPQNPTVYKINDSNYFKIRDLAAILNGTEKQFSVGYDSALRSVTAATGEAYQLSGTELQGPPAGGSKPTVSSNDAIYIDGKRVDAEVYKIDGSNYFKLRDLGKALDFYVGWTAEQGMYIETDKPYSE